MPAIENPYYRDSAAALQDVQTNERPDFGLGGSEPKMPEGPKQAISLPVLRDPITRTQRRDDNYQPFTRAEGLPLMVMEAPLVQQPEPPAPAEEKSDFGRGFQKSLVQAKQTAYGTAALIGDTIGNKGLQDWGLKGYQEKEAEVQKLTKETDSLKSFTEGKGDLIDWMQQGAGYLTGQVLEFGASALAGAAVGSVLPGAGTVGGAVIGFVEKEAAKKGIKSYVAKMLEQKFAEGVAARGLTEEAAAKYAGKTVMRSIGAKAGSMLASSTMELGSIYGDAIEQAHKTGEDYSLGKIWLTGIGAAALDSAMDWINVGKFGKAMGGKDAPMSIFKETFKAGAREGITEFMQTGIERYGANKDLTGAEAMWDYIDSAALGAFGGSLVGGGSAAVSKVMGKKDPMQQGIDQGKADAQTQRQGGEPGGQPGGQTGIGDGKGFGLDQPAMMTALEGQPGLLSALYSRASEADQKEIFKAANRMNLLDELQASEGDLTRANELIASDPDHATFLMNSLVNIGKTPPKGGLVKMPQKGMTLDDLERIDQGISNDPNAMASMQQDAEIQRQQQALKKGLDPNAQQGAQNAPQGNQPGGQGVGSTPPPLTPPKPPVTSGGMTFADITKRLVPQVKPTNYDTFKYSAPAVRNGFAALGVDLSQVSPSGNRGQFTYADLKRINDLLYTAEGASKSGSGVLFSKDKEGEALGVYIPQAKTVFYSSAAKNLTPNQRYALELHEAGAHFGIPRMVGEEKYNQLLTQLAGMRGKDKFVDQAFAAIPKDTAESDINHEALAYLVQNYQNLGIVKTFLQYIKDWFGKTFKGKQLTSSQLHGMAVSALRNYGHELRKVNLNDRIITKPEPGKVKVDFQSALGTNPQAHQFLDFMSQFGNSVALTGSLAISPQLDIYRPQNEQIHDLDFRVMDPARLPEIMEKLQQTFPNSALSKTFASKKAKAETIQLVVDKDAASPLHIDLFVPTEDSFGGETVPHTYTGSDGQQRTISLNNAKSIFDAKFAFGRAKDVNDAIQSGGFSQLLSRDSKPTPTAEAGDQQEQPEHIRKLASRVGASISQDLVDEIIALNDQGKTKESEAAAESVERIYKAQMDGVVKPGDQLKVKAALERKGQSVAQRIAAAEKLVDDAYAKETIPDKGVLNRAKRVQKYFNAIAAKYKLPDAAVDVGGTKRTVSALNTEIESLLQGDTTKQNVVTANELLALVAQARMKQVLDVAGARGQGLLKNMARVTSPDRRATDTVTERNREPKDGQVALGGRMIPGKESGMLRPATNLVSDIENTDGTTSRVSITDIDEPNLTPEEAGRRQRIAEAERRIRGRDTVYEIEYDDGSTRSVMAPGEKQQPEEVGVEQEEQRKDKKATEPDPVYPDFWSNYYGSSTASGHFRRLVDLVVEQYLRMLPVAGNLKDLTGVAKQYYGKIGSGKRSAVGKMWRTLDRNAFIELVKMTGRERKAVPEPTEADIALMQYKNDVRRAMLMTERPNIFTAFGQTYVAKDKKGFKEALIVANERLDNLFAAINGIQKTGNVKNQDVGGVFSQMEFPSGPGDRASEAAMVDIKSRSERSIEAMKAEARDLQETIVMLQQGMVREAAQRFNKQLNEVKADIDRLSVEAVERGAPQDQVMKVRDEAMRSIVSYQQSKKRQSKPSEKAVEEEVADLDQSGPVGIEAAKALVSDLKNKKIDLPSAVAAASTYLKEKEFTQSQLVDAFREQGADIPDALLHSFHEVASRNRMADFVRRNGGGYAKRSEWMHSMNNVVENRKFYAQNSSLRDMNPLAGFTPVEIDLYKEWKAARADLARRQQDRGDLSQSSDLVEEAFPDLLFVRFTLDEMRDFKKIRKDSARAMISDLFGDPDTAVNAYFEDIVYAASKRPDLIKTIPDYLPAEEVADFAKWRVQKIAAEKLRAKMIEDSKYFLALERIVPNPSSGYYQEKFPDQEQRRKEIRRATRLWNKFKYLGEKDRIEILQNEAKIREGASPVAKNTGEMDESLLQDLISDLMLVNREEYSADERIASFDRAAATPMQSEYSDLENLGDQSAEEALNAGETNLDDVQSGIRDLEAANLNFDEDPEYMASQDEEADQQQDDDDIIRTARGAYSGAATAAIVQVWAARISKGWRGAPAIKVLNNPTQLDEPLRSAVLEKTGEVSTAKGLYVTDDGSVYLFSDYLTGEADAEWTLFHEVYGHYGMRAFLGNEFDAFLQTVYLTRPEIRQLADAKVREEKIGVLEAVEEVLSDKAGDAKYVGVFKQMLGRMIRWLRKHGFDTVANYFAKVSDAEVAYVLKSARDAVREGTPAPFRGAPAEVRLSQQKRTPYEAFAIKDGKTLGYARFDPWRNTFYVFNAINGDPTNYNVQSMSNYADVQKFLRKIGKFESRLRSGYYIDNKLLPDLTQGIPDYRDNPSWVRRKLDWLILNTQNEYLPVFRVVEWLEKNGGRITDMNDVRKDLGGIYERETAAKLERFRRNYVEPIMDLTREAKNLGATQEFMNDFAVARHAAERNAQVVKTNPGNRYGSGMAPRQITTRDGRVIKGYNDIIDEARRRGLYDTLERIGVLTDKMSRAKIADQVATGLIHPLDAQARMAAYKHYVNMSGVNDKLDKFDDPGIVGQKFGRPSKEYRAMGRGDVAPDVIARTIAAAEASIIQGQKNILKQRLLSLMEENHDPNFVSINKYATKREIGDDGFVHEVEDTRYLSDKGIMLVRVKGIPVTMEFKQTGKGSFADAILGAVYPPEANALLNAIGKYQNIVGRMLTTWNPVWVGINFMRDAQALMFNAAVDKRIGTAKAALMVRRILPAARASIYVAMNDYKPTTGSGKAAKAFFQKVIGQPDPKMLAVYRQARDAGALTSFIDRLGLENQIEQIHKAMTGENVTGRVKGFLDFMELMTIPMEMGPRLAAYSVTREMGWSQRDAAQFSGEITVNFNMRGKQAWLRQLYLFLNPAVQGTAKMISLAKENPARFAVASAAFVGLGMMVSMAGRMFSDDDDDGINKLDKVPAFKRATSMVLRADTPFAAIPIPYGWNAFFAAGTFAMDTAVGAQPLKTTAKRVATAAYEAFMPVGGSGLDSNKGLIVQAAKMVAPTAVLPIVEWMTNENRYGGPIRKEGFPGQANPPDAYMAFRSVNPIARGLAEGLNKLTGGHRNKEGAVDFNPAIVDHAINAYLPGVFNEIYKLAGTGVRLARGEAIKEGAMPVVDRFSAPVREDSWNAAAYARVKEIVDTKWREYEKAPSVEEMRATIAEYKGLGGAKAVVDSTSKAIRELESNFSKIQLAADRGQISEERLVQVRNQYDEYKRKHYARAIKAVMQVGEGDNRPIRDALLGG